MLQVTEPMLTLAECCDKVFNQLLKCNAQAALSCVKPKTKLMHSLLIPVSVREF